MLRLVAAPVWATARWIVRHKRWVAAYFFLNAIVLTATLALILTEPAASNEALPGTAARDALLGR